MATKKDQLIETALALFCRQGFKATGIDLILKEAGVAKMTLYQHFPFKEALIAESLRVLDQRNLAWYTAAVKDASKDPKARLRSVFAPMRLVLADKSFSGCPFVRAAGEYPNAEDPIHVAAVEHKEKFRIFFEDLARDAGRKDAKALSRQMQMLFEGTMAMHQVAADKTLVKELEATWATVLA